MSFGNYTNTVSIQTNGLPKDLRYSNIENSEEQLILVESSQYNLAVVAPENCLLFDGKAKLDYITLPESSKKRKAFIIQKNNPILVREICTLFNDETWKSECLYPPENKGHNLPQILTCFTSMGNSGAIEIEVIEYTEKSIVLFSSSSELASLVPSELKSNNYTYVDGTKRKGFMLAKSSKLIPDLKKFVGTDFEVNYSYPVGKSHSESYSSSTTKSVSSLGPGPSIAAPSFSAFSGSSSINPLQNVAKSTIKDDVISLLTKLKDFSGVDVKEVLTNTSLIYGESEKVEDTLKSYDNYQVLMKIEVGENKQLQYIKLESI